LTANSPATLLHNAVVCAPQGVLEEGWVLVEGGLVARVGQGRPPPETGAKRIDVGGRLLAPGLIDLHVHGAVGHDAMDATPGTLERMARFYARHGVTAFLATTTTGSPEATMAALRNVAEVMGAGTGGAALLGAHLEGPYLNSRRAGAQNSSYIRDPDPGEYRDLLGTGVVRLVTLAPELPGSEDLIRFALAQGAVVSAGHTLASYQEMCRAVELGVTQVTHLFNGMEPLHHRRPGAVGAALVMDRLRCQLIADQVHVHPPVLDLVFRLKGADGVILITDAMRAAAMPDGQYDLGALTVTVQEGVVRLPDGALAGSTLTLERALANMMACANLSLPKALPMATSTPARALGLEARKGAILAGRDADLIVLGDGLKVRQTMVAGEIVYQSDDCQA